MNALITVSKGIDAFTLRLGRLAAWLLVAAIVISTVNAIIRKLFDASSNTWLELQWVLFGAVFLLCASWTLQANEHIRIDIVNSTLSKTTRNAIELIGHVLFLIPMVGVFIYTGLPFFLRSYAINEQSANAGGLAQWPAKFLIVAGFTVLAAQAISELIKRIAVMRGLIDDSHAAGGHHAAAEAEAERLLALAEAEGLAAKAEADRAARS